VENPVDQRNWRKPSAYSFSLRDDGLPFQIIWPRDRVSENVETKLEQDHNGLWKNYWRVVRHKDDSSLASSLTPTHVLGPLYKNDNLKSLIELKMMQQTKNSSLNAALALAESRESVQLLASYIRRVAKVARAVKHKDPSVLFEKPKNLSRKRSHHRFGKPSADIWLETMYGLRPLLSDSFNLIDALTRGITERDQLLVARKSYNAGAEDSTFNATSLLLEGDSVYGGKSARVPVDIHRRLQRNEAGNLWWKVDDPVLVLLKEVGFTNPATVVWDKIPLISLLVDWVLPIGQYLELLDYAKGLAFLGGAYTVFDKTTYALSSTNPDVIISNGISPEYIRFTRTPYNLPPEPELPTFRNPFKVERAVSATALLRQRLFIK
jgi:hypothetical protein